MTRIINHTSVYNQFMLYAFKQFWLKELDFSGKTGRREFWLAVLANSIIMVAIIALVVISLFVVSPMLNQFSMFTISMLVAFCIVELLPSIALIIRRMHDIGKSGYYIWVLFIPVVGFIWYLWLVTRPTNYYKTKTLAK